ncbi:hypothetical protein [Ponticaulis sp.]|uniref:hypothetical protein n=1 Tax=Ponticaulis sp. TaxID=2020902 RepID=UPI000B73F558|nr:hypothetical protein [Ponticaulis sp.]MAJ07907.1 hypothetical protein [Ponticaulis sp.]RPG18219.1 MAG: hypothetical protein CBC85_003030 [Hyphomonadaceae bacterium TMED125]|tara:strand:+ start:5818 stop:6768 length:951 start_codon:yes stop_codon:yes gene_type:complete
MIRSFIAFMALGLSAPLAYGQELAQRCDEALFHLEDAMASPAYYGEMLADVTTPNICAVQANGERCYTGAESAAIFQGDIPELGIERIYVSRIAYVLEVITEAGQPLHATGCERLSPGRFLFGAAYERYLVMPEGVAKIIDVGSFVVETSPDGSARLLNAFTQSILSDEDAASLQLFTRPEFLFDRRRAPRMGQRHLPLGGQPAGGVETLYADIQTPEPPPAIAPAQPVVTAPAEVPVQPASVIEVSRTRSSGAMTASAYASHEARRNAEAAVREACSAEGGRIISMVTRSANGSVQLPDGQYEAEYTSTARCELS